MTEIPEIPTATLGAYRAKNFCLDQKLRLRSSDDAVDFINERGYCYFWPIKDVLLPSLWVATVGDCPVADKHDDPGHVTWGWKDGLLDKRVVYYAKILRRNATFIALEMAPYFYALSPNYGDYENDYLVQYKQGQLRMETKAVYEALLQHGPLHTLDLREKAHLSSKEKPYRFDRALSELQAEMKILPIGIANVGRWGYAMRYEIVARYYPQIVEDARFINEGKARKIILQKYIESVGAATLRDIQKLFQWEKKRIEKTLHDGLEEGWIREARISGKNEIHFIKEQLLL